MVQISWGYDEGDIRVNINEISRHDKFWLFPSKQIELIARIGDVRAKHFAIKNLDESAQHDNWEGSGESLTHQIVKGLILESLSEYIKYSEQLVLEKRLLKRNKGFCETIVYDLLSGVDKVQIEKNCGEYRPDISLYKDDKLVKVIEIIVTHNVDKAPFKFYREKGVDIITVNVEGLDYSEALELRENIRDMRVSFREVFADTFKTFLYLNNVPDFSNELDSLDRDIISLSRDAQHLRLDYTSLWSEITPHVDEVKLSCEIKHLKRDADNLYMDTAFLCEDYTYLLGGLKECLYAARIEHFKTDLDSLVSDLEAVTSIFNKEAESLYNGYKVFIKDLNEVLGVARGERDRLIKLKEEEHEKQVQLELERKNNLKLKELREQKEAADKKNALKKKVNRRAAHPSKCGVSLDAFGFKECIIKEVEVKNSIVVSTVKMAEFLLEKDEG